ncbi:MAG: hypothetical protein GY874_20565 [Desulfobacteraceae bacterium]|nr:hypothetical protein [Desulfobacteraceae bacterium]
MKNRLKVTFFLIIQHAKYYLSLIAFGLKMCDGCGKFFPANCITRMADLKKTQYFNDSQFAACQKCLGQIMLGAERAYAANDYIFENIKEIEHKIENMEDKVKSNIRRLKTLEDDVTKLESM